MKNIKSRGFGYERELVSILEERGFCCIRVPASGGRTKRPLPDIIAGKMGNVYIALEVKFRASLPLKIQNEQVEELKEFSDKFGAIPMIALKIKRKGWFFMLLHNLNKAEKSYTINKKNAVELMTLNEFYRYLRQSKHSDALCPTCQKADSCVYLGKIDRVIGESPIGAIIVECGMYTRGFRRYKRF